MACGTGFDPLRQPAAKCPHFGFEGHPERVAGPSMVPDGRIALEAPVIVAKAVAGGLPLPRQRRLRQRSQPFPHLPHGLLSARGQGASQRDAGGQPRQEQAAVGFGGGIEEEHLMLKTHPKQSQALGGQILQGDVAPERIGLSLAVEVALLPVLCHVAGEE